MDKRVIIVQTTIQAPIETIWEIWTEPKHIIKWNFATEEWCCPTVKNELRIDGEFVWRMEAKDGSMGFDFTGTYKKIMPNELIAYQIADGRTVDVSFSEKENGIEVSQTFEAEGTNADEQQKSGWQAILENFKKYVESTL